MKIKNEQPNPTARIGKIARLPHDIRDQINRRLQNNEPAKTILKWLNPLPEVQAVLKEHFNGVPISPQNVSEWRAGGYRDWEIQQNALQLAHNLEDEHSLGHKVLTGDFSEKLARWLTIRLAAAAQALASSNPDPNLEWTRLRELCADATRLRRGDLHASHIGIRRERLALDQSKAESLKEEEFWAWTQRPDIQKKLYPERKAGMSDEAIADMERMLNLL